MSKSNVALTGQAHAVALKRQLPDDPSVLGFEEWVGGQSERAETFQNGIDALSTDPTLTNIGRGQAAKTRVIARLAEVGQARATVTRLDQRIAELRQAALRPSTSTEDPVLRYLRHQEIRGEFKALKDGLDKQMVVDKAVREGDTDTLAALAAAPKSFPAVDPDVLTRARAKVVDAANPDALRFQRLRDAHSAVLAVAEQEARSVLDRYGLTLESEPVKG
jgi:hypothetical protein